ncbi:phosphoribosylaminoimidazolesuccinocarboxamide synthase [Desulfobaculum bizertense]|uniref:Phosphoribosylaminoimidazole-succinocarboxamide synthase n=1 Tax=Desulfobaculum bizertense DSM 18034 TaxID=1121442 RepID=A0A1T4VP34_9BACT|nr:phosphoribosylaminoimidazolesuccinocarboxamide synthase [Desulfobaculum bizertense]UIJ38177.1 phosphoribosylaminoimidazolesuccinocarboxamide synthase [Desulfobaculum bizertense]SKA66733.1 phosphoribosylaminoimidazole-succinocarboxamide synthase [Desulfobaculum bizertense DSM 18034]
MKVVTRTEIQEFPLVSRGKVRDIYDLGEDRLLIVTTDRMSAFDVIMNEPIPYKGAILNQITLFWMDKFKDIIPNHLITADVKEFPAELAPYAEELEGRSVIVKKAKPLTIECIVRGFITGSGWKDYQAHGSLCGYALPAGLQESEQLPEVLFTPSTKAELGEHDENITLEQARERVGAELLDRVNDVVHQIYSTARDYAAEKGIIIADTKFEFGLVDGELILIDEVLTPDSSRFWPAKSYKPGASQPSFDKQYLRDWLSAQDWDKTPPAPTLPQDVIDQTFSKYAEAFEILTGTPFSTK